MSLIKSVGKNTLGGGKKMKVDLRTYNRSTHDLSYIWRSSMAAGTLVPFCKILMTPGDTMEIDLTHQIMTHPTIEKITRTIEIVKAKGKKAEAVGGVAIKDVEIKLKLTRIKKILVSLMVWKKFHQILLWR